MPRRAATRLAASTTASAEPAPSSFPPPPASLPENLVLLRKQWKWAAISQFFFTFDALLAMDDVKLKDVEDDLVLGSSLVLPRIIVRLLYTLSYDRKVNLNNWQTTLRRQYNKRNPAANPIGPEPINEGDYFHYESPEPESTKMEGDTREQSMASTSGQKDKDKDKDEGSTVKSEDGSTHPHPLSKEHSKNTPEQEQELQESKDWLSLSMMEKLDSLHLLTEWQFQSPNRVRTLMKSDDDQASWRIEPIGYDAKRNAYWLIGADRLWIQRVPPKPPRPPPKNSLKRKRTAGSQQSLAKSSSPAKRPRLQSTAKTKSSAQAKSRAESTTTGGRQGRAAKAQANMKLDAQAKELAELNRQAGLLASGRTSRARGSALLDSQLQSPPAARASGSRLTRTSGSSAAAVSTASTSARPLGTRLSARLRGLQDEEWQAIPDEWLDDNDNDNDMKGEGEEVGKRRRTRAPSPSRSEANSSISELTELTEDTSSNSVKAEAEEDTEEVKDKDNEEEEDPAFVDESKPLVQETTTNEEFVEWETLAVTLYDWEHIAERWENATHYSEKALYKVLTKHIVPIITEELKELEKIERKKQKQKEEEVVFTGRKRSSRLAIKESEKEEAKAAARRKEEEEEKMSRARRAEARQQKEEADRISRESAREQRRREREAKEEQEAREAEEEERKEREKEERAKQRGTRQHNRLSSPVTNGAILLHHPGSNLSSANGSARGSRSRGSRTPASDDWELDCEICHRRGINLDDNVPLMCCGSCSKWQHIRCHDQADMRAGRPRRNWDQVDFVCLKCRFQSNANANSSSLGGASSGVGGGYNGAGVGGVGGGVQMHYLPNMQNVHPSLRAPNATGSAVAYNHVPYGYDPGSGARMGNGGYVGVRAVNGIGNLNPGHLKGSAYGTSDVRSSSQAHMSSSYANDVPTQTQKQMYYQSRQLQQPEFSNGHGQDSQHSGYRDHPPAGAGYGHSPTTYGPQYGNHNNSQTHNMWNGVSTNHSLGYPSTSSSSYMPSSAERSSALAESSSRYDAQSHYTHQQQGQQQWHRSQAQGLPQNNTNISFATSPLGSSSFHPPPHRS